MAFAVEEIPWDANLFRRIHRNHINPSGIISSQAFKQEHLSVNWEKYSDAPSSTDENSAAVVALVCEECRALGQTVEHTPIEPDQPFGPNQAHVEICGNKSGTIMRQLRDIAKLVWHKRNTLSGDP
jgi:phage tail sheath protein FI